MQKPNPDIAEMLKNSSLPLDHYYVFYKNNKRVVNKPNKGLWVIEELENIRNELKEETYLYLNTLED